MPPNDGSGALESRTFRLPRSAYLAVLFLIFCAVPISFTSGGDHGSRAVYGWRMVFLVVPVLAAVFIARTATFVTRDGIRVRAAFGSRRLAWEDLRGLTLQERAVYAVVADGAVRLPCVRVGDLATVTRISAGKLPQVAEPKPKFAPQRKSRRR